MRKINPIWALLTLFCATSVLSVELSESDYRQTFNQLNPITRPEITSIDPFVQNLEREPEISRIIHTHQALILLSGLPEPTEEHKKWVNSLIGSKDRVSIVSADHPRKRMIVIDVSRQANTTIKLWEINQHVAMLEHKWISADWQWADLIHPINKIEEQALLLWLTQINLERALDIAEYLERNPYELSELSNNLLAVIAQQTSSNALFAKLWNRTADDITYKTLNRLSTRLSESDAISQLKLAVNNPQLASQALFLMSKDYGQQAEAQLFIEHALFDPKLQLQMAMTVGVIKDPIFKDRLKRVLAESNNKVAKVALKQLNKEVLQ
jgi:hypothetical protein